MDFFQALTAGLRLALLGKPRVAHLRLTPGVFWLMGLVTVAVQLGLSYGLAEAPRQFALSGLLGISLSLLFALLLGYLLAQALGDGELMWPLATLLLAAGLFAGPLIALASARLLPHWEGHPFARWIALGLALLWWAGIIERMIASFDRRHGPLRHSWLTLCAVGLLGLSSFVPQPRFWSTDYYAQYQASRADEPPPLVAEQVFGTQQQLLEGALSTVPPGRRGVPELYFVAFGAYAGQDVFLKETAYTTDLFERRFGLQGRTLALVNHRTRLEQQPLATLTNLRYALHGLGERMNVDEDILFLFLTSHGSEDAQLTVELGDLSFLPLTPDALAGVLRGSGIRWKVVVVSGCYSGAFIDALKDARSLVISASRADRKSFGCSDDAEFTWFGRAFFEQALNRTASFRAAFDQAGAQIREWEKRDQHEASEPQIAEGALIEDQLRQWRATLPAQPRADY